MVLNMAPVPPSGTRKCVMCMLVGLLGLLKCDVVRSQILESGASRSVKRRQRRFIGMQQTDSFPADRYAD